MIEDCLGVVNCQQVQPAMSMVKGAALMTSEPVGADVVQTKNRSISAAISNFSYTEHILQDNHKCHFLCEILVGSLCLSDFLVLYKDFSYRNFKRCHTYFPQYVYLIQIDYKLLKDQDQVLLIFITPNSQ